MAEGGLEPRSSTLHCLSVAGNGVAMLPPWEPHLQHVAQSQARVSSSQCLLHWVEYEPGIGLSQVQRFDSLTQGTWLSFLLVIIIIKVLLIIIQQFNENNNSSAYLWEACYIRGTYFPKCFPCTN